MKELAQRALARLELAGKPKDATEFISQKAVEIMSRLVPTLKGKSRVVKFGVFKIEYPSKIDSMEKLMGALAKLHPKDVGDGYFKVDIPEMPGSIMVCPPSVGTYGTKFGPSIRWIVSPEVMTYAQSLFSGKRTDVNKGISRIDKLLKNW